MATIDPAAIRRWWSHWPEANVAVRTGAVSGIVVLDVDPGHGGDATLDELLAQHGPFPPGPVVATGSGGRHFYFAHPGGVIRNDAGRRLGAGIDIRGDGGYVIAPPSRHACGEPYTWHSRDHDLPHPPDWLLSQLRQPLRPPTPPLGPPRAVSSARPSSAWARAALEGELAKLTGAPEGTRNETLNRASFCLSQIVAAGGLEGGEVERLLLEHALAAGLSEREARATIASGMSAGARHPRRPATTHIDLRTVYLPGTPTASGRRVESGIASAEILGPQ